MRAHNHKSQRMLEQRMLYFEYNYILLQENYRNVFKRIGYCYGVSYYGDIHQGNTHQGDKQMRYNSITQQHDQQHQPFKHCNLNIAI